MTFLEQVVGSLIRFTVFLNISLRTHEVILAPHHVIKVLVNYSVLKVIRRVIELTKPILFI